MIDKFSETLKSPRFWAAVLAIVFVLLHQFVPAVADKVSQTDVTSAVIALVAFIAAASVGSHPSYIGIFCSVRFWSLLVSLLFIFVRAFWPAFPISEDLLQELIAALGVVTVGLSYRPVGAYVKYGK